MAGDLDDPLHLAGSDDISAIDDASTGPSDPNFPERSIPVLPENNDVCFKSGKHPGTVQWRETVKEFADQREQYPVWNNDICEMIRKSLAQKKIQRYLVNLDAKSKKPSKKISHGKWFPATEKDILQRTKDRFNEDRKERTQNAKRSAPQRKGRPKNSRAVAASHSLELTCPANDDDSIGDRLDTRHQLQHATPVLIATKFQALLADLEENPSGLDPELEAQLFQILQSLHVFPFQNQAPFAQERCFTNQDRAAAAPFVSSPFPPYDGRSPNTLHEQVRTKAHHPLQPPLATNHLLDTRAFEEHGGDETVSNNPLSEHIPPCFIPNFGEFACRNQAEGPTAQGSVHSCSNESFVDNVHHEYEPIRWPLQQHSSTDYRYRQSFFDDPMLNLPDVTPNMPVGYEEVTEDEIDAIFQPFEADSHFADFFENEMLRTEQCLAECHKYRNQKAKRCAKRPMGRPSKKSRADSASTNRDVNYQTNTAESTTLTTVHTQPHSASVETFNNFEGQAVDNLTILVPLLAFLVLLITGPGLQNLQEGVLAGSIVCGAAAGSTVSIGYSTIGPVSLFAMFRSCLAHSRFEQHYLLVEEIVIKMHSRFEHHYLVVEEIASKMQRFSLWFCFTLVLAILVWVFLEILWEMSGSRTRKHSSKCHGDVLSEK